MKTTKRKRKTKCLETDSRINRKSWSNLTSRDNQNPKNKVKTKCQNFKLQTKQAQLSPKPKRNFRTNTKTNMTMKVSKSLRSQRQPAIGRSELKTMTPERKQL